MRQTFAGRRAETLDYMQSMLAQLRVMAEAENCDMLAYLIEMSCIEVNDVIAGERQSAAKSGERNSAA